MNKNNAIQDIRKKCLLILFIGLFTGTLISGINNYLIPNYYVVTVKFQAEKQVSEDYIILIKSRPLLEKVIYEAKADITLEELDRELFITALDDTRIIKIELTDNDPLRARVLMDAFIGISQQEYGDMLRIKVVEHSKEATALPKRNLESFFRSFLLGAFLSLLIISIKSLRGFKIKKTEEIQEKLNISILAVIPKWNE